MAAAAVVYEVTQEGGGGGGGGGGGDGGDGASSPGPRGRWRVADLFCGCGGMSAGWRSVPDCEVVLGADANRDALLTYAANLPRARTVLLDMSDPDHRARVAEEARRLGVNVVVGGPPCQGFSRLNNHAEKRRYLELNQLPIRFAEVAVSVGPELIVMEEVAQFVKSPVPEAVLEILQRAGYDATFEVLDAQRFGVPQRRTRCILVARRRAGGASGASGASKSVVAGAEAGVPGPTLPAGSEKRVTVREALAAPPRPPRGDPISESSLAWVRLREEGRLAEVKPGWHSNAYGLMNWDAPSPTLTTNCHSAGSGTFTLKREDDGSYRRLSRREAMRLFSFDDGFSFPAGMSAGAVFRQLGNSVPPGLAAAVARHVTREAEMAQAGGLGTSGVPTG